MSGIRLEAVNKMLANTSNQVSMNQFLNAKQRRNMETEQIIKLVILFVIISLVYTTIKAVVTGIKEGVQNTRDILSGTTYEQIQQRNKQKQDDAFKKDLEKMDSKLYRFTHPLEYLNCIILKKIKGRMG